MTREKFGGSWIPNPNARIIYDFETDTAPSIHPIRRLDMHVRMGLLRIYGSWPITGSQIAFALSLSAFPRLIP